MTELKDIIKDKLRKKQWTFNEIVDVKEIVNELAEYTYDKMNPKDKLELIWESNAYSNISINTLDEEIIPIPFGSLFQALVKEKLQEQIAIIIKDELIDATIIFKEDNKNEISKRSVGGKPHKERKTDNKGHSEK